MKRPNILFFLTDDQRHDTVSCLGNGQISTPNLDALVERGTAFTNAHIPGGTRAAVCMPSRAMIHTGRSLFRIGREGQEIPADCATLGECFRQAGYETFGVGKWHNGRSGFARSFSCGDEIFFGGMGDHWNVPAYRFDPSGKYDAQCPYIADPRLSNKIEFRGCDHIEAGKHSTDLFVDASTRFLERRQWEQPFFMFVSLMAPHDPRSMPVRLRVMYDPARIGLPENFLAEHPIDTGALRVRDEQLAAFPRNAAEIRRHLAEYYAMISHLDDAFGRLLAALERTGKLENTIVVFTGDNGLAIGQHGLMGKQNLYDHSVRVPLVFAGPGIPRGKRRNALAYLMDIFPTLCDVSGISTPQSVEGRSLAPSIEDANVAACDALYLAYGKSIRGLTDGRRKLIEYACGQSQLFDLRCDPLETENRIGDPAVSAKARSMRERLWQAAQAWDDEEHPTGREFWATRSDLKGAPSGGAGTG